MYQKQTNIKQEEVYIKNRNPRNKKNLLGGINSGLDTKRISKLEESLRNSPRTQHGEKTKLKYERAIKRHGGRMIDLFEGRDINFLHQLFFQLW